MKPEWKQCVLSDIGEIVGGGTPSTKNENYYGGDIAWITPKDLSGFQGRYIERGERNITAQGLRNSSARLMPANSILFTSRAPIGYVAIAKNEVCTNQGFKSIVPNSETDYLFLYYMLKHNSAKIEALSSGTTFKEVSGSVMKQVEVYVPTSKAEQQRIANILGALDDKIENNIRINRCLEQMAHAVYKSWFVDFEPWDGVMPGDWREGILSELTEFKNGKSRPSTIGAIPVYGGNGILSYSDKSNASNTVIIGRVGAYCGNIFLETGDCWVSDNAIYAKSKLCPDEYHNYFLLHSLGLGGKRIGTSQPLLTQGILSAIEVMVPSSDAVNRYNDIVSSLFNRIRSNIKESACLAAIRDALLPRLISGKLPPPVGYADCPPLREGGWQSLPPGGRWRVAPEGGCSGSDTYHKEGTCHTNTTKP